MLRVHDTSATHSDIYKELGMEKYCSETDWKPQEAKKTRRKSNILVDNRKEGIQTRQGMNCQGHGILILVAGIPIFRDR